MAGSVNKVILLGNLGADPEVREFPSGGKYCRLTIATGERWKDRSTGESREKTEWHNVTIYAEPLVRVVEKYLRKGEKVYIEGRLETRKWQDGEGRDRYATEVVLRGFGGQLCLLGSRGDVPPSEGVGYRQSELPPRPFEEGTSPAKPSMESDPDIDDDIPF